MSSPNIKNSKLKDLDLKLKNVRDKKSELKSDNQAFKSAHVGWRMVLELVIGILIGVGLGSTAINIPISVVAKHFPISNRTIATGIVTSAGSFGYFVSPLIVNYSF